MKQLSRHSLVRDRATRIINGPTAREAVILLANFLNNANTEFPNGYHDLAGDVALFKFGLIKKEQIRKVE